MSRRNPIKYEPAPNDLYPTPLATVLPLILHLKLARVRTFSEPCAGEGDLKRNLENFGLRCTYAGDITTGQDALDIERFDAPPITNPPYSRRSTPLLLKLIRHFLDRAPFFWLLLPHDRLTNKNMQQFLPHMTDVVVAGRNKVLQNGGQGHDNLVWIRFERAHTGGPKFHNGPPSRGRTLICAACGEAFRPVRTDARFCSAACKQRAYRKRLSVTQP